ncbi:Dihydroflavonol-4-reductase [Leucoagaricus sp. SymC.cos]|nr:Dihydroflavonol-4-reductase [Leucoagaricus sp. SymC.cos]
MMSVAIAPSKVLVTGVNGYIAITKDLEKRFNDFIEKGRLELVVVADLGKVNTLLNIGHVDAAVDGVEGIIHTASPITLEADDPQEPVALAVAGTLEILKSGTLKRIVFTSSVAAIMTRVSEPATFSESDWNTVSVKEVEELFTILIPQYYYTHPTAGTIPSRKTCNKYMCLRSRKILSA